MSKIQKWAFILVLLTLLVIGTTGQQQQSGGNGGGSVTISAALPIGSNTIGNVKMTDGTNFMPTGDSSARTIHVTTDNASQAVTFSGQSVGLNSGSSIIGLVAPFTGCGTTKFAADLQAVPTSNTAVTSTKTCVVAITCNNTNASAQTLTVTDQSGTPLNAIGPAYSIPGLAQVSFPFNGIGFTGGLKWQAGGTGINCGVVGVQ